MAKAKRVFSGIQPTGGLHLGNYLGALKQWVALQKDFECIYCVVDLHAATVPEKAKELRDHIFHTAALCLAAGIDPERSILFVQSDVAEHSELCWVLNCYCYMGELRRMTQFKDKTAGEDAESVNAGLFGYPVLMAADIFLYDATHVPVGDDQKQHLELSRTIARRFNNIYGDVFTEPEGVIPKQGARIMALDDATKKMSKSSGSEYSFIALTDSPDKVRAKLKSAQTDSGREVAYDPEKKPAVSNLLDIFSLTTGRSVEDLCKQYGGAGYAVFKKDLGEAIVEFLRPIQEKLEYWKARPRELEEITRRGSERASALASRKMAQVKSAVGLGLPKTAVKNI